MTFDSLGRSAAGFVRRFVVAVMGIATVAASSYLLAPDAAATLVPIAVDDIPIFVPCADLSGNAGIAGASVTIAGKTAVS